MRNPPLPLDQTSHLVGATTLEGGNVQSIKGHSALNGPSPNPSEP